MSLLDTVKELFVLEHDNVDPVSDDSAGSGGTGVEGLPLLDVEIDELANIGELVEPGEAMHLFEGAVGYKGLKDYGMNPVVATVYIPAGATVVTPTVDSSKQKLRTDSMWVVSIESPGKDRVRKFGYSPIRDPGIRYQAGEHYTEPAMYRGVGEWCARGLHLCSEWEQAVTWAKK